MSKFLFVVAHCDDEILGAGGLIYEAVQKGHEVSVLSLNSNDETRYHETGGKLQLVNDLRKTHDALGVTSTHYLDYPDSNYHRADHRGMVQDIERIILTEQPDYIFTQHPGDINSDHYWTAQSCMEAFRLWQRGRIEMKPIKGLYLMEVQSSTDWSLNPSLSKFEPNTFFEIGEDALEAKIDTLKMYENVVRPVPHPRSEEAIRSLALLRGAQSGHRYAEAFQCVFRRYKF